MSQFKQNRQPLLEQLKLKASPQHWSVCKFMTDFESISMELNHVHFAHFKHLYLYNIHNALNI